jgi:signal transduction histidine kinase
MTKTVKRKATSTTNGCDALILLDSSGVIQSISRKALKKLGYTSKEIIHRSVNEVFPEISALDNNGNPLTLQIHDKKGYPFFVECKKIKIKLDSTVHYLIFLSEKPKTSSQGDVSYWLDFSQLILSLSTRLMRNNGDSIDDIIQLALKRMGEFTGVDRCILLYLNPENTEIHDIFEWHSPNVESHEKLLQNLSVEIFPWWDSHLQKLSPYYVRKVADLSKEAEFEQEVLHTQSIQSTVVLPLSSNHKLRGFLEFDSETSEINWTPENITMMQVVVDLLAGAIERKRARDNLRLSQAQNLALVSAMPDMIFRITREGILQDFTIGDEQVLFVSDEFIGKSISQIFPPEIFKKYLDSIDRALTDKRVQTIEYKHPLPEGIQFYEARFVIGGPNEVLAIVRNTSDRAHFEQMKTDFVNRATHELRTPLTTSMLMATLLEEGVVDNESHEYWQILQDQLKRLQNLTDDLLAVSRFESHSFAGEREPLSTGKILKVALGDIVHQAEAKNITVEKDIDADLPQVLGNEKDLYQAFTNLFVNAIKFTPEGGRVIIDAQVREGNICIRVGDTGIGIPPDDVKNLFSRFYRASNAIQNEIPGTGIGLFLVKSIVEGMGGLISVESELGVGTTFTLIIPPAKVE